MGHRARGPLGLIWFLWSWRSDEHIEIVVLEIPGVEKNSVEVRVEDGVLKIDGRLDFSKYQGLQPLYTEYNVGHYSRSFRLSSKIDQNKIAAELKDGVLSLVLPKVEEAKPRTIQTPLSSKAFPDWLIEKAWPDRHDIGAARAGPGAKDFQEQQLR